MTICLDPGHAGKYNPYLQAGRTIGWESETNWSLTQKLKSRLEAAGIEVLLTRQSPEEDPELLNRGRKSEGCDLFLSLHTNAGGNGKADYPMACCTVGGTADAIGYALAQAVREAMDTEQSARIWKRDYQTGIGTMLFSAADPQFGQKTHPLDYYGVLRGAAEVGTPGVLLECSFHDHPKMLKFLTDDASLDRLADALCGVLCEAYAPDTDWKELYEALLEGLSALMKQFERRKEAPHDKTL